MKVRLIRNSVCNNCLIVLSGSVSTGNKHVGTLEYVFVID
jgi:hypothetical protein